MLLITGNKLVDTGNGFKGEDADIFEEVIDMQDSILDLFGLSYSDSHYQILNSTTKLAEIETTIEKLKSAAEKHLLSSPSSELKLLQEARKYYFNADQVLSELKIKMHTYTIFICQQILTDFTVPETEILKEFNIIRGNDGLLNNIGILALNASDSYSLHPKYLKIKQSKLKYFEKFITQFKNETYINPLLN